MERTGSSFACQGYPKGSWVRSDSALHEAKLSGRWIRDDLGSWIRARNLNIKTSRDMDSGRLASWAGSGADPKLSSDLALQTHCYAAANWLSKTIPKLREDLPTRLGAIHFRC